MNGKLTSPRLHAGYSVPGVLRLGESGWCHTHGTPMRWVWHQPEWGWAGSVGVGGYARDLRR
jgi:hypothetical protein